MVVEGLTDSGAVVINAFVAIGGFAQFALRAFSWTVHSPATSRDTAAQFLRRRRTQPARGGSDGDVHRDGSGRAELSFSFDSWGWKLVWVPLSTCRWSANLGPVLAATMLAGRIGSRLAAQLGTMRVTEQIDALDSMGANPIHYLVVPRFLACFFVIPSLTIMADFMGVVGGYIYSIFVLGIDKHHYLYNSQQFVGTWDFLSGDFQELLLRCDHCVDQLLSRLHLPTRGGGRGAGGDRGVCAVVRADLGLGLVSEYFSRCGLLLDLARRGFVRLVPLRRDEGL